jgi:hypothetical protein
LYIRLAASMRDAPRTKEGAVGKWKSAKEARKEMRIGRLRRIK